MPIDRVPASARSACRAARRNGHLLFICSGRAKAEISRKVWGIGFDGVVSSSGALIELGGEVVHSVTMARGLLDRITGFLDERRVVYVMECPARVVVSPTLFDHYRKAALRSPRAFFRSLVVMMFWRRFGVNAAALSGDSWRNDVCKVVFMADTGAAAERAFTDFEAAFGPECEICRSSIPGMLGGEVTEKGVHKGAAVELVARYYGAAREDVIAFGDGDNDRTMLEAAGRGIAMGNAVASLKAIADDVAGSVDRGGLAAAFRKYGLI
jgi:Cof subfamily protein (haloacid dehalogenase superfamily)